MLDKILFVDKALLNLSQLQTCFKRKFTKQNTSTTSQQNAP